MSTDMNTESQRLRNKKNVKIARAEKSRESAMGKGPALVKPVLNSVSILRYLCQSDHPATLTEISRELKINPSTCLSIVRTLVTLGLIVPFQNTKAYTVGAGIAALAAGTLQRGIPDLFHPPMERIARHFNVTVTLWRQIDNDRLELIASAVSNADVKIQMRVGQRLPRWISAIGRIMAAHGKLSDAELRSRFKTLRWQTQPSFKAYMEQVRDAKRRGYAIDDGDYTKGVLSISVPVFDMAGEITMGCSATMFAGQHSPQTLKEIAEQLAVVGSQLRPQAYNSRAKAAVA